MPATNAAACDVPRDEPTASAAIQPGTGTPPGAATWTLFAVPDGCHAPSMIFGAAWVQSLHADTTSTLSISPRFCGNCTDVVDSATASMAVADCHAATIMSGRTSRTVLGKRDRKRFSL